MSILLSNYGNNLIEYANNVIKLCDYISDIIDSNSEYAMKEVRPYSLQAAVCQNRSSGIYEQAALIKNNTCETRLLLNTDIYWRALLEEIPQLR